MSKSQDFYKQLPDPYHMTYQMANNWDEYSWAALPSYGVDRKVNRSLENPSLKKEFKIHIGNSLNNNMQIYE